MTDKAKPPQPMAFKNLAELKRHIKVGTEFKATSHKYHPNIVGLTRVVTKVQTNGFYSKIKDEPDHRFSDCNGGKGFFTELGKAGEYIFDGTAVKVLDKRGENGVIYAKDIFAQDLLCEYKKQTEHRDALKVQSREVLAELIAKINSGTYDNPQVEDLLQALAKRLAVTNGKKQYGYLRKDIKEIINNIVDELGKDERIAALYDLWYESKETALKVYSERQPERLPLSQNKEFKSVKNMVIAEAMKLGLPTDEVEETDEPVEPDREPTAEEAESPDPPPPPMDEYERTVADADKGNKWSQYRAAKFMLDRDGDHYDPKKAVEYLTKSAKQGYTVAKYMLGKLYLKGEDVPKQKSERHERL